MYSTLLHRPRNSGRFAALMELYEQNYMLMRVLAPDLHRMAEGPFESRAGDAMPLEISEIKHTAYTSTFKLTYRFSSNNEKHRGRREPDLSIRLYHDARSCEVMSGLMPEGRIEIRRTRDLEEGRRLNRFLRKWLAYCLRQGHSFTEHRKEPSELQSYCAQY